MNQLFRRLGSPCGRTLIYYCIHFTSSLLIYCLSGYDRRFCDVFKLLCAITFPRKALLKSRTLTADVVPTSTLTTLASSYIHSNILQLHPYPDSGSLGPQDSLHSVKWPSPYPQSPQTAQIGTFPTLIRSSIPSVCKKLHYRPSDKSVKNPYQS